MSFSITFLSVFYTKTYIKIHLSPRNPNFSVWFTDLRDPVQLPLQNYFTGSDRWQSRFSDYRSLICECLNITLQIVFLWFPMAVGPSTIFFINTVIIYIVYWDSCALDLFLVTHFISCHHSISWNEMVTTVLPLMAMFKGKFLSNVQRTKVDKSWMEAEAWKKYLSVVSDLSAQNFERYCVLWRTIRITPEASCRGQGPESNVKYLVGVMNGGTHTLRRHAGQPAEFTQKSCREDKVRP